MSLDKFSVTKEDNESLSLDALMQMNFKMVLITSFTR